jgi:hypothetical protein
VLVAAGAKDAAMVRRACDFLGDVAGEDGAVPLAFPVIEDYPRAEHWSEWAHRPGLNPTAGLVGLVHKLGIEHPWVGPATAYCWAELEEGLPEDAHALGEALVFLEHVPQRSRAESLARAIVEHLQKASWFRSDPADPGYGVTPLHYAPSPESRWRPLFADRAIDGHLDRLERDQQEDGGWPLTWEPPSAAATLDYRGIETLRALRVLSAYGRIRSQA